MATTRVPIRVGRRSRLLLRVLFGVRADDSWIQFGWSHFRTTIGNVASWRIEGPFRWITAIGVRRSIRHGDVTFGGSPHGGLRLNFREPVRIGPLHVPALYVTVEDLEGLGATLATLG